MLSNASIEPLQAHLLRVRELHERDLTDAVAPVFLPYALSRKYPGAGREWGGSTCFWPPGCRRIRAQARFGAIISLTRHFSVR